MKKIYKLLLSLIVIEFYILSLLNKTDIKIQSWIGGFIVMFVFLLPIEILLFKLGQDENFTKKKRMFFKVAFGHIAVCYVLSAIGTLIYPILYG